MINANKKSTKVNKKTARRLYAVDLFAGAGVLSLGFEQAGFSIAFANEIDDWAASYPAHVVKEWAGHASLETTDRYYLQVSESEYERASTDKFWRETEQEKFNKSLPNLSKIHGKIKAGPVLRQSGDVR